MDDLKYAIILHNDAIRAAKRYTDTTIAGQSRVEDMCLYLTYGIAAITQADMLITITTLEGE